MTDLFQGAGVSNTPGPLLSSEIRTTSSSEIFIPDREYESSPGVFDVLGAIRSGAPIVFISGKAGTGKSTLIDYLRAMPGGDTTLVVAPTGIAALNLDAMTIHTAFKLPLGVIDASNLETAELSKIFCAATRIVIDEISMVRADVLDGIDQRLKITRRDPRPFGGVQLVMVGDFLQLPPVLQGDDRSKLALLGYRSPYAFSAKALRGQRLQIAALTKVWRQRDPALVSVLADIREGKNIRSALRWLNERCVGQHRTEKTPIVLTVRREDADLYNSQAIQKLRGLQETTPQEWTSECLRTGVFENSATPLPAPQQLTILPGMRVMSVKNDISGRFANGTLGTVLSFQRGTDGRKASVRVLFDGAEDPVSIEATRWTKNQQMWCERQNRIVSQEVGSFEQIPLVPGYAITIHKSQGLSLDDVRIDLGKGAFAPGQLYVALSRARSVEGLSLARSVDYSDALVEEVLVKFLTWIRGDIQSTSEPAACVA